MVYLTLTTIPTRLNSKYPEDIRRCLDSLLNQTYTDFEIHLNIPSKLKYTQEEYIIPDWLKEKQEEDSRLKVFTGLEDLGPVTKVFYTVPRVKNPEDFIIVVDDDIIYDERMVQEQLNNQNKFVGAIVCYDGIDSVDDFYLDVRKHFCSGTNEHNKVNIAQHYKSVSYKRKYFESDFEDFIKTNLTWDDDLLISAYFSTKKRDRISTHHIEDPIPATEDEWRTTVGNTFPFKGNTQHEREEGCNVYRDDEIYNNSEVLSRYINSGYHDEKYNKLQTVIYTNDVTLPVAEVALQEFKEYAPVDSNITIVTNKLLEEYTPKFPDYIFSAEVDNNRGFQFAEVMTKYLKTIDNEYIFFLLDDYITLNRFSRHDFNRVLNLMTTHKVDYFSLDKKHAARTRKFENYPNEYFDNEYINVIPPDDIHRFSVQPCIWKRESLINLLEKYPDIDVHKLETDKVIANESLKTLGFNWHVFKPEIPSTEGFEHHFMFTCAEIIRHGVFMCLENGYHRGEQEVPVKTIRKVVEKYKMIGKKEFKKVLFKIK